MAKLNKIIRALNVQLKVYFLKVIQPKMFISEETLIYGGS